MGQKKPKQETPLDDDSDDADDVDDTDDFDPNAPRPTHSHVEGPSEEIPPPGAKDKWEGPAMQRADNIVDSMMVSSCGAMCILRPPPLPHVADHSRGVHSIF